MGLRTAEKHSILLPWKNMCSILTKEIDRKEEPKPTQHSYKTHTHYTTDTELQNTHTLCIRGEEVSVALEVAGKAAPQRRRGRSLPWVEAQLNEVLETLDHLKSCLLHLKSFYVGL